MTNTESNSGIDLEKLINVVKLRWCLLAGCIGMAVVVSAIFIISAYRLSSDMGKALELEALDQESQQMLLQLQLISADKVHFTQHLEDLTTGRTHPQQADSGLNILNFKIRDKSHIINGEEYAPLLELINSRANTNTRHDVITYQNTTFAWSQAQDGDRQLTVLVVKKLSSLDTTMDYISKRLSITSFLTFWGAIWAALIISGVVARKVELSKSVLVHMATHDSLTSLPNRVLLITKIEQFIKKNNLQRSPKPAALLMIGLNNFKKINDSLGHSAGDSVLRTIASRLQTIANKNCVVAAYGGDKFVCWIENTSFENIFKIAQKISRLCHRPIRLNTEYFELNSSIGITEYPTDSTDWEALLNNADIAMHRARNMRMSVAKYQQEDTSNKKLQLVLQGQLQTAIDKQQFVLFYQPKVELISKKMMGVEALARWQHPTEGLLYPDSFIDLIEQTGIVHNFSRYILEQAISQASTWAQNGQPLCVAVNLSPYNLIDPTLIEFIREKLDQYELPPSLLEIELTESATMVELKTAAKVFQALHELGIKVSIDDFGTGMSSLAYLKGLNVDYVKIDRAFIADITDGGQGHAIVEGITSLCKHMDKIVVAEGVETAEQAELLKKMGCQFAQGYFFGKPMTPDNLVIAHSLQDVVYTKAISTRQ